MGWRDVSIRVIADTAPACEAPCPPAYERLRLAVADGSSPNIMR